MTETRNAIILLLLAACGTPAPPGPPDEGVIDLGAYDQATVERRYPALAGKLIGAEEAEGRFVEPKPTGDRWIDAPEQVLRTGTQVRVRAEEQETTFTVPGPGIPVDAVYGVHVTPEGMTAAQLRADLNQKLSRLLRFPQAQVQVREDTVRRSDGRRFTVAGMVKKPGDYRTEQPPRVRMAVAKAGGAVQGALPNQILVVRGREAVIVVDMLTPIEKRDVKLLRDPRLRDGDIVVVPRNFDASADCAAEWEPIAAYVSGQIDRQALLQVLR